MPAFREQQPNMHRPHQRSPPTEPRSQSAFNPPPSYRTGQEQPHSQRSSYQPSSSHPSQHYTSHHSQPQQPPQQQHQASQHHHHQQQQQQQRHSQQFSTHSYPSSGVPVIQSSDPSFGNRPHSRSFSSTHQPKYPPPEVPSGAHPRLHHSTSAGHLPSRSSNPNSGLGKQMPTTTPGAPAPPAPKRKDPYATAWRTYSKIAEELNLLNPDGTLYPISKEAILKYLRHQSKRIKSSNLHWYVNGLKKHQENLGIPWDNIRYDEQVVALLKELTLNPVPIDHGDDHSNQWHQQRSRPVVSAPIPSTSGFGQGRSGHHYTSASIDTARIASLSISSPPQQHQQNSSGYGPSHPKQYSHQYQQRDYSSHPPQSAYSHQPPNYPQSSTSKPHHHSAPISLSSSSEFSEPPPQEGHRHKSHSHALDQILAPLGTDLPQSPTGPPPPLPFNPMIPSSMNVKRKRYELVSEKTRRITSPMSPEGEEQEGEATDDRPRQNENISGNGTRGDDMHDEDMDDEDNSQQHALKRRASTGTLLSQKKASPVNHVPGPYISGPVSGESPHLYQRTTHNDDQPSSSTTGPRPIRKKSSTVYRDNNQAFSPPDSVSSIGSTSPIQRPGSTSSSSYVNYRSPRRPNGVVSSPISAVTSPSGPTSTPGGGGSKTTVQFSEVVEYAQLLQARYGGRCREHPWGCVELSPDHHLELTIKMYMDWAGLVASGRLTMEETPDLPEFRIPNDSTPSSPGSSTVTSPRVGGGTLKRMTSTPIASFGGFTISSPGPTSNASSKFKEGSPFQLSNLLYRSPSSSPISSGLGNSPRMSGKDEDLFVSDSLMSRIGSPPPQRKPPSSPPGESGSSRSSTARARKIASSPSLRDHGSFHLQQSHPAPPLPPVPDQYKKMARSSIQSLALSKLAPPPQIPPPKHHPIRHLGSPEEDGYGDDGMIVDQEQEYSRVSRDAKDRDDAPSQELRSPLSTGREEIDYFDQGEELIKMRIRTLDTEDGYRQENEYRGQGWNADKSLGRLNYEDDRDNDEEVVQGEGELEEEGDRDMESVKGESLA
ncbi:hypothetical protein BGZ93_003509 [Podila epicladia]|nr:hypothetical protein BGZ93_003509 [Podila epicladia]